jgi:hypothetical protein
MGCASRSNFHQSTNRNEWIAFGLCNERCSAGCVTQSLADLIMRIYISICVCACTCGVCISARRWLTQPWVEGSSTRIHIWRVNTTCIERGVQNNPTAKRDPPAVSAARNCNQNCCFVLLVCIYFSPLSAYTHSQCVIVVWVCTRSVGAAGIYNMLSLASTLLCANLLGIL